MNALLLAMVWGVVAAIGFAALSKFERSSRLVIRAERPSLAPSRALWGGDPVHPPSRALTARMLAGFARLARPRSVVVDHQQVLRAVARGLGATALFIGLAMLPFVGTWGGGEGPPFVLFDANQGLALIALILLFIAFARISVGLAERSPWSRMGSARQSSRAIASMALLTIVLAPLAIDAGSLRLHDIVSSQQLPIEALIGLLVTLAPGWEDTLRAWPLPSWNLFVQPLTALLFAPAIALWVTSPRVDDPATGSLDLAGAGLDADPSDLYWSRFDARLARVFAAGLFVTLFLGAGSIPFLDPGVVLTRLAPYYGEAVPSLIVTTMFLGSFVMKMLLVLAFSTRLARIMASARDDRALRLATRRLIPLAWANLLLVAALSLWFERLAAGGAS